jgi:hypothetical protein
MIGTLDALESQALRLSARRDRMVAAPIAGYVRCGVIHSTDTWRIEIDSEQPPVGALVVRTGDGEVTFALNRKIAEDMIAALQGFLGKS